MITDRLRQLSAERGYSFTSAAELEVLNAAKEALAYVALDFHEEREVTEVYEHCPNSHPLSFGSERFRCTEILFNSDGMWEGTVGGIQDSVEQSLRSCHPDLRRPMIANVVLTGGTAMLPGLPARLAASLLKGPRRHVFRSGPWGPKLKKPIFNLFLTPGVLPNRFALKFYYGGSYFRNFWWHGMKISICYWLFQNFYGFLY